MTNMVIRYPLDPTGKSKNNLVTGEPHALLNRKVRVFVPNYGAFFVKSMNIYDAATGVPLTKNQWEPSELDQEASLKYGAEICYVVLITDTTVSNNLMCDYQALGSHYGYSTEAVINQIDALKLDNRTVAYKNITGLPDEFTPSHHLHDMGDLYGAEYIKHYMNNLRSAIATTDAASHDAIYAYVDKVQAATYTSQASLNASLETHINDTGNPHKVTAAQIGVYTTAQIDAMTAPISASLQSHIANTNNPHKVTAAQLGAYTSSQTDSAIATVLNPIAASLQAHVNDLNNPHKVTPALIGTYSASQIDALNSAAQTALTNHINNTSNPHDVTAVQIGAYTTSQIDTAINGHAGRTDNPHAVTAAQIGAYTRAEADALLALKQDASNAVSLATFNAMWDTRMNQRFAFTYMTAATKLNLAINVDTANYNIYNAAKAAGWNGADVIALTLTIAAGAWVYSTDPTQPALDTGLGWPLGVTINVINNGYICGAGGAGGSGASHVGTAGGSTVAATGGNAGGPAINLQWAVNLTNNGYVMGGGGGGAGGDAVMAYNYYGWAAGGGGGGGAGYNKAAGGSGGTNSPSFTTYDKDNTPSYRWVAQVNGSAGSAGGTALASGSGAGGAGGYGLDYFGATIRGNAGGAGGSWGSAGAASTQSGGAGGYSVKTNGYLITWGGTNGASTTYVKGSVV